MGLNLVDTHCHLYHEQLASDLEEVLNRSLEAGVSKILLPNIDRASWPILTHLVERHPETCFAMVGLHPCDVFENWKEELDALFASADRNACAAVGEIGLDLHWDKSTLPWQEAALKYQIEKALEWDLPICLHTRNATQATIDILKQYRSPQLRGVFHCFSESRELAAEINKLGFYIGIGGVYTFKNAKLAVQIQDFPKDKILLETDSPFLAPVPHRGKRNEPAYVRLVAEAMAANWGTSLEEVAEQTTQNAHRLFPHLGAL
ncbi:MAG: TatD family hydrolase [Bacteroidia bacterium]